PATQAPPTEPAPQAAPAAEPAPAAQSAEPAAPGPGPAGGRTGKSSDIPVKDAKSPTPEELLAAIGHNKVAINMMWVLITGFLVMFMQTGFAMVETGLTQAKNAAHTFAMNFMIY